jgi:hypothetical protein
MYSWFTAYSGKSQVLLEKTHAERATVMHHVDADRALGLTLVSPSGGQVVRSLSSISQVWSIV